MRLDWILFFLATATIGAYVVFYTSDNFQPDKLAQCNASLSAAESELDWYYQHSPVHLYLCKSYQSEPCK